MEGNSDYAIARRANIKRNNIELSKLKLKTLKSSPKFKPKSTRKKRGSTRAVSKEPRRRSKRTRDIKPAYTGEKIDRSMDMEDEDPSHTRTKKKKRKKKMAAAEILEKQKVWLQEKREFLVSQYSNGNSRNGDKSTTDSWYKIAVSKWGKLVTLASATCVDWERYVLSRTSTPSVTTEKFGILQEEWQHCPWRLLICCVLMSRVSSEAVKTLAINRFFAKYRTPSDVLDVTFNPTSAFEILRPLGLFENRLKAVVEISSKFLTMPEFAVGMDTEVKLYGVGEFGCDSFSIFIRGEARNLHPNDRTLAAYCRWSRELN